MKEKSFYNMPYSPWKAPYTTQAGTKPLAQAIDPRLFLFDHTTDFYLNHKKSRRADINKIYCAKDFSPRNEEIIVNYLADKLFTEYPNFFARTQRGVIRLDREQEKENYLGPLDELVSQVPEDLFILQLTSNSNYVAAAHVNCGEEWEPLNKVGHDFIEVHAPVGGMSEMKKETGDGIVRMLSQSPPLERFGWVLRANDELYVTDAINKRISLDEQIFARAERQTITFLPEARAIIFTFRTYITPLENISLPEREIMAQAIESMKPAHLKYKDYADNVEGLIATVRGKQA